MGHSLCNRCELYSSCGLNFDGTPCRKLRSVEPTNYDRLMEMDAERLAAFHAKHQCPPGKDNSRTCLGEKIKSGFVYGSRDECKYCWLEYLNLETKENLA